jgi:hypothetical protein
LIAGSAGPFADFLAGSDGGGVVGPRAAVSGLESDLFESGLLE